MHGFKNVVAAMTVAAMVGSSAFAADHALVPGKPAGIKSAQQISDGTLIIGAGAAAVVAAIAIVVSNQERRPQRAQHLPAAVHFGHCAVIGPF